MLFAFVVLCSSTFHLHCISCAANTIEHSSPFEDWEEMRVALLEIEDSLMASGQASAAAMSSNGSASDSMAVDA
jgi:hypothetical protein